MPKCTRIYLFWLKEKHKFCNVPLSLPSNRPISKETSRQDGRGPCLYQYIILHQLFKESLLDGLICSLLVILFYFSIWKFDGYNGGWRFKPGCYVLSTYLQKAYGLYLFVSLFGLRAFEWVNKIRVNLFSCSNLSSLIRVLVAIIN